MLKAILVGACLLFSSCVYQYNVKTTLDEFEGNTVHRMTGNNLAKFLPYFFLNGIHLQTRERDDYSLEIIYQSTGWLRLKEGPSLVLLIDGVRVEVKADGVPNETRAESALNTEIGYYPVEYELLKKIGAAKTVKVQLIGETRTTGELLSSRFLGRFRKFAEDFPPRHTR